MSTEVKIIADSVSQVGKRITTFQLYYPRSLHSEMMTHRVFSRNASSTRAIPLKKQIEDVINDPYIPIHWGKNQPGMSANEELDEYTREGCKNQWLAARDQIIFYVQSLDNLGLHKQIAGRLLEPWNHIHVVVTSTEWDNFYQLRTDKAAHPDIRVLANRMLDAHNTNIPRLLRENEWHLPYVMDEEKAEYMEDILLKCSVARCARVSYKNHDKSNPDIVKDMELHDRLLQSRHMSSFEHCAYPLDNPEQSSRNFRGWQQYRANIKDECCYNFKGLQK